MQSGKRRCAQVPPSAPAGNCVVSVGVELRAEVGAASRKQRLYKLLRVKGMDVVVAQAVGKEQRCCDCAAALRREHAAVEV